MVSADGGRTWTPSSPPAELADVVVDPLDERHLVAASGAGLTTSRDAGQTWSPLPGFATSLAWPTPGALYAFSPDGAVRVSADDGETWTPRGGLSGEPAAVTAVSEKSLIVALHDGSFTSSADGGRSWSPGPWASQ